MLTWREVLKIYSGDSCPNLGHWIGIPKVFVVVLIPSKWNSMIELASGYETDLSALFSSRCTLRSNHSPLLAPSIKLSVNRIKTVYTAHLTAWSELCNKPTLVHLAMWHNSHTRHNSNTFRHYYFANIREIQYFQLKFSTSKRFRYKLIYTAFHATRAGESSGSSRVIVFAV